MRLTALDPQWVKIIDYRPDGSLNSYHRCEMAEAQGLLFLCPKCFATNNGPVGTHSILCWSRSRGVPDAIQPAPGRWTWTGTGFDDVTFDGDPPGSARSILLTGEGCGWHGFITAGEAS